MSFRHLFKRLPETLENLRNGLPAPITMDNGKTTLSISIFLYYAGWADKIHGDTIPTDGHLITYTKLEPVWEVGQIIK